MALGNSKGRALYSDVNYKHMTRKYSLYYRICICKAENNEPYYD